MNTKHKKMLVASLPIESRTVHQVCPLQLLQAWQHSHGLDNKLAQIVNSISDNVAAACLFICNLHWGRTSSRWGSCMCDIKSMNCMHYFKNKEVPEIYQFDRSKNCLLEQDDQAVSKECDEVQCIAYSHSYSNCMELKQY